MRAHLRFLILDDFDPDTGELALRVAFQPGADPGLELLRLRLHLGRAGNPIDPLSRELRTHVQMPVPPLWEHGLKTIIHAIEEELAGPEGRHALRYLWVRTQLLHPADPARSTPNHPVPRQVEVLRDWANRLDQEGQSLRAAEVLDRLLLLAPKDVASLVYLTSFFRAQGMAEEMASVAERWIRAEPDRGEARLRHGEALLRLGRAQEARAAFETVLKAHPMHLLAHVGMAQALGLLGGNPFPHLDAAQELDPAATASVLRETFDYRLLAPPAGDRVHPLDVLPGLLGVSGAEVQDYLQFLGMPNTGGDGAVRESELARWVGVMNRYALLPAGLHWSAPTPRHLPELP
ncbi:tetratricopeptide repeat protein [Geothrix sp. 21YS21S-4]|uniref:tetratricopeptide repeat protein n=1 Tax=Geothrix sp. 21YS21S-4 TaxID=3068889 RepID=UPI0027BB11AC|nr:tetratricopeptide repeat protein [Geothrix sp. 21YS21S-4]